MTNKWIFLLILMSKVAAFSQPINIIPQPAEVQPQEGYFELTRTTQIIFTSSSLQDADFVGLAQEILQDASGLTISPAKEADPDQTGNIQIRLNRPFVSSLGTEGYSLKIQEDGVFLSANTTAGLLYGIQSIWQLLTAADAATLPCMQITDYPRFGWRGLHLDVSRHFMPVEFIYKFIDYLALHKMNVFHWHLVDDQGWRIEIKKYPKLTEIGAWRADREHLGWDARKAPLQGDEPLYGGFYTQEEVKAIVAYAAKRNVTIVPEIEMPAHLMSALAAYPQYSCTGEFIPVPSGGVWPITHIACAGNDEVFDFLEGVLSEVMQLFPSTFIHIGGDEATKTEWQKCERCQARIQEEQFKDEHELQAYFIERIERFLNQNGRDLIGWDEILEGGLDPSAAIMSWRGSEPGIKAAKAGHNVVMSPGTHCYFDHYQGNPSLEPKAWGGFTTLKKVYHYEPIPAELTAEEATHIIGVQANVWTEFMPDGKQVEYMIMPRMSALSEVVWSPKASRDWSSFSQRMDTQYARYRKMGVNYATSAFQVSIAPIMNPDDKSIEITLSSDALNPDIRYTLDGSTPNADSSKYVSPFRIDQTTMVKAVAVKDGENLTEPLAVKYFIHQAIACPVDLKYPNSEKYDATGKFALVNGIKGSIDYSDNSWQGFDGNDFVATIDLGESKAFSSVTAGVLQNSASWIYYPSQMTVEVSVDGERYSTLGVAKNHVSPDDYERQTQDLQVKQATEARYLRVTIKNLGTCPPGHSGEGQPAWLFVDEIVVE